MRACVYIYMCVCVCLYVSCISDFSINHSRGAVRVWRLRLGLKFRVLVGAVVHEV